MFARVRFLAGLMAMVALALSTAGAIAASACAAEIELAGIGASPEALAGHMDETALDDCAEAHGGDEAPTPWCPMAPGAGQTCSTAALLPGLTVITVAGSPAAAEEYPTEAREPNLLLAAVHYHPPKS